ncbi:asparaginase [Pelagibaculum spongiae]|uniref:asparaginase n=1 Tax=Pelagibaculum spongiae TaxID=2080658 RepID=A0A2V1GP72_9GAMM|nr:asparaginase [Pelagibaculum spongiae]PVZ64365.1 L-asparaginase 1 [Pelagibaculum spongiae]
MNKVLVIYTGGTIGMQPTDRGYAPAGNMLELINQKIPAASLSDLPQFELLEYQTLIDSSNIQPENWAQIATDISKNYAQYDGFVVLHGTDTMAYTASMLSFMLQGLSKPVIVTGSQIPLCRSRTDAVENIVGALTLAANDQIAEVCLYFNGRVLRGNRARKLNAWHMDAFDSPNFGWLGRLDIKLQLNATLLKASDKPQFDLTCQPEPLAMLLPLFPGISPQWILKAADMPAKAIILHTYGAGNGPESSEFLAALKSLTDQGKLIVNLTQCLKGAVVQDSYAAGTALAEVGVISGGDMTPEAAFCKLHFLFSQGLTREQVIEMMRTNLVGEISL